VVEFKPSKQGLHYTDMSTEGDDIQHMLVSWMGNLKDKEESQPEEEQVGPQDKDEQGSEVFVMVNTVWKNFAGFTKHEIKKAEEARRLQGMFGNPTDQKSVGMVRDKLIKIAPSMCLISRMLTKFLERTLLTSGARQHRLSWSM
jgi:hypothetical protein